jgi:CPA2 family monovalent cation:H+ antiporter-2
VKILADGSVTFESLMLVVGLAFLIPILLYKLKLRVLPVVVAEIIAGLIIGKSGLQIVGNSDWLDLLSLLGFIYLMFLSGLEIDFSALKLRSEIGTNVMNPIVAAIIIFMGIFLVSGGLSVFLVVMGFVKQVFLTTLIISTISLGVVVPVLKERRMLSTVLGQTLLLVTVLADFFTMIMLAVYVSALSHNKGDMLLLITFFGILIMAFFIIKYFSNGSLFRVLSEGSIQFGTRAVFALLLAVVFLSETLGVEYILGAFLAGVIVSLLRPQKALVHQLESFGYGFLIPIFFVMVGVNLQIRHLLSDIKMVILIPLLLVLMFVAKIIPMLYLKKWISSREVLSSALLLSSKLSLVIAAATLALDLHLIDIRLHGAFILVAIVSCLLFPILFNHIAPQVDAPKKSITIVGLNHISIPVSTDLIKEDLYQIQLFTANKELYEHTQTGADNRFGNRLYYVQDLTTTELDKQQAFQADIIILATTYDDININLGKYANKLSGKRVIVRIEGPDQYRSMRDQGFEVFSTVYAARRILRSLIDNPSTLQLIIDDEPLVEVVIGKAIYSGLTLREMPFPPNVLVLRIYRGNSSLVPNGSTEVYLADRLLMSGNAESINNFRELMM